MTAAKTLAQDAAAAILRHLPAHAHTPPADDVAAEILHAVRPLIVAMRQIHTACVCVLHDGTHQSADTAIMAINATTSDILGEPRWQNGGKVGDF